MPHLAEPVTIDFEYTDAHGNETTRTVDVYRTAKKKGHTMITGWCHDRQAQRSFRSDRVRCIISEYGEVLSAEEWLATLTPARAPKVAMADPAPPPPPSEIVRDKPVAEVPRTDVPAPDMPAPFESVPHELVPDLPATDAHPPDAPAPHELVPDMPATDAHPPDAPAPHELVPDMPATGIPMAPEPNPEPAAPTAQIAPHAPRKRSGWEIAALIVFVIVTAPGAFFLAGAMYFEDDPGTGFLGLLLFLLPALLLRWIVLLIGKLFRRQ